MKENGLINQLLYHRDFWILLPASFAILCCGFCLTCGIFGLLVADIQFYEFVTQDKVIVSFVVYWTFCGCIIIVIIIILLMLLLGLIARYWLRQELFIPKTEKWPYVADNVGDNLDEPPVDLSGNIDITYEITASDSDLDVYNITIN